jgi:hypothetical protein
VLPEVGIVFIHYGYVRVMGTPGGVPFITSPMEEIYFDFLSEVELLGKPL